MEFWSFAKVMKIIYRLLKEETGVTEKTFELVLGFRPKGSRRFMNPDYSFPGSGTHQPFTHRIQRLDMASG